MTQVPVAAPCRGTFALLIERKTQMKRTLAILATTAFMLASAGAQAAQHHQNPSSPTQQGGAQSGSMMGQGGMMDQSGMGHGMMLKMMMAMMDTNGDGALSLEEVQAVHARMFAMIDADDDGQVTVDEIQSFMQGGGMTAPQAQ